MNDISREPNQNLAEADVHELGPRTFQIYPSLQTITQTSYNADVVFRRGRRFTILGKRKESKIME